MMAVMFVSGTPDPLEQEAKATTISSKPETVVLKPRIIPWITSLDSGR